jgi:hypothetical protein
VPSCHIRVPALLCCRLFMCGCASPSARGAWARSSGPRVLSLCEYRMRSSMSCVVLHLSFIVTIWTKRKAHQHASLISVYCERPPRDRERGPSPTWDPVDRSRAVQERGRFQGAVRSGRSCDLGPPCSDGEAAAEARRTSSQGPALSAQSPASRCLCVSVRLTFPCGSGWCHWTLAVCCLVWSNSLPSRPRRTLGRYR